MKKVFRERASICDDDVHYLDVTACVRISIINALAGLLKVDKSERICERVPGLMKKKKNFAHHDLSSKLGFPYRFPESAA